MLGLFRCSLAFESHPYRLSSLRVLVLGLVPAPASLVTLRQLVYLHIEPSAQGLAYSPPRTFDDCLAYTIRWLSVHHQLRSFSVERIRHGVSFMPALLSCDKPTGIAASRLAELNRALNPPLDPTVPCALSDLSLDQLPPPSAALLGSLPSLTRLQTRVEEPHWYQLNAVTSLFAAQLDPSLQRTLLQLHQLRMEGGTPQPHWEHLVHCAALRTVHLTQYVPRRDSAAPPLSRLQLQSLLRAWSATLEECRLELSVVYGVDKEGWRELAACHQLRVLELRLLKGQALPEGFVAALQELPSFQSLALNFYGPSVCPLPSNLLTVMARSRSFSSLHLRARDAHQPPDFVQSKQPTQSDGLSFMLSTLPSVLLTPTALARIRVFGYHGATRAATAHCYRIVQSADQQYAWEREY